LTNCADVNFLPPADSEAAELDPGLGLTTELESLPDAAGEDSELDVPDELEMLDDGELDVAETGVSELDTAEFDGLDAEDAAVPPELPHPAVAVIRAAQATVATPLPRLRICLSFSRWMNRNMRASGPGGVAGTPTRRKVASVDASTLGGRRLRRYRRSADVFAHLSAERRKDR